MVEQAMMFAMGFAVAGLLALAIAPAFWRRALRLSSRRLELLAPFSAREIIAERDLLRAAFAVERRVMEQRVELVASLRTRDRIELGRRDVQLAQLRSRHASLTEEHGAQTEALATAVGSLGEARAELARVSAAFGEAEALAVRQEAELAGLRAEIASLSASDSGKSVVLADYESEIGQRKRQLAAAHGEATQLRESLTSLGLEQEAAAATLKALSAQLADREAALRAAEIHEADLQKRRRRQVETARSAERRMFEKITRIGAAESAARQQLALERERADGLAQQLEANRRLAAAREGGPAATEQEENALLRQTVNEIGAAVIRMSGLARDDAPEPLDSGQDAETGATPGKNVAAT